MRQSTLATVLRAGGAFDSDRTDERLLADFFDHRDERAFATLVRRHERIVWGVCRRVLANAADAEDAFQATFLVLVCRGRTLAERGSLGGWLHRVASRIAMRARTVANRRRLRDERAAKSEGSAPEREDPSDLMAVVGEELDRLPEHHRLAIIVCDLDGLSRADAAARLCCSEGTLSARLHRGRKQLAQRLRARGITTPAIAAAAASPAPAGLGASTVSLAEAVAKSGIFNRAVSASVAALVSGTARDMTMRFTAKVLAVLALMGGLLGGGWVGLTGGPESTAHAAPVPPVPAEGVDLPPAALDLLKWHKVLRVLKCAPEQRVKIEDHFDDWQEKAALVRSAALAEQPNMTPEEASKLMSEHERAGRAEVAGLLKPNQLVRLGQIELQIRGVNAFADEKVAAALKLTDDQKSTVREAIGESEAVPPQAPQVVKLQVAPGAGGLPGGAGGAPGGVFQVFLTSPEPDPKQRTAALEKVLGGLTADQQAAWKKLTGDKIGFALPSQGAGLFGIQPGAVARPRPVAPAIPK